MWIIIPFIHNHVDAHFLWLHNAQSHYNLNIPAMVITNEWSEWGWLQVAMVGNVWVGGWHYCQNSLLGQLGSHWDSEETQSHSWDWAQLHEYNEHWYSKGNSKPKQERYWASMFPVYISQETQLQEGNSGVMTQGPETLLQSYGDM